MSTPEAIRSCLDVLERGSHFHHFPRPKTLGASKLDSLPWGDLGHDWAASRYPTIKYNDPVHR